MTAYQLRKEGKPLTSHNSQAGEPLHLDGVPGGPAGVRVLPPEPPLPPQRDRQHLVTHPRIRPLQLPPTQGPETETDGYSRQTIAIHLERAET